MENINSLIKELQSRVDKLVEENKELKSIIELSNADINEILTNEKIIKENKYEHLVNKVLDDLKVPKRLFNKTNIIFIRDNSASMGALEINSSKILTFWYSKILERMYVRTNFKYILYNTSAVEVNLNDFLNKEGMHGTIASEGLNKANEIIESLNYEEEDVYIVILSDGDNLTSDNKRFTKYANRLINKSKKLFYIDFNYYGRNNSELYNIFEDKNRIKIKEENYYEILKHMIYFQEPIPNVNRRKDFF